LDKKELTRIIKGAQKGDSRAKQALYLESSRSVYFLAYKILKNKEDAEDITQDVFITVFDKLDELKKPVTYTKWVNRITANKCMSFLRKTRPLIVDEQDILEALELNEDVESSAPEKLYDDEETRRIILEIIDTLPEIQRVCIMFRYFNQLTIEEIAGITGTNVNTVKSRLATARKKLRAAIIDKEEKDGIRLHVLIPIMPVLMRALEEYEMPDGVQARMWENISMNNLAAGSTAKTSQITQTTSGQPGPMSGEIQNAVLGSAGKGVTSMVSSKAIAIILSIIGGAAVITAAVIYYPQISEMLSFSNNMGEIIADVIGDETTPPIQSEIPNTETSNQQQGQQETDTPSLINIYLSEGTYEGELDENGLFTGWGVWNYYNTRYEGYFENGMPNGEGTFYITGNDDADVVLTIIQGIWIDGLANNEIKYTLHAPYGEHRENMQIDIFVFEVANGHPTINGEILAIETNMDFTPKKILSTDEIFSVPPWTFLYINYSNEPPTGNGE